MFSQVCICDLVDKTRECLISRKQWYIHISLGQMKQFYRIHRPSQLQEGDCILAMLLLILWELKLRLMVLLHKHLWNRCSLIKFRSTLFASGILLRIIPLLLPKIVQPFILIDYIIPYRMNWSIHHRGTKQRDLINIQTESGHLVKQYMIAHCLHWIFFWLADRQIEKSHQGMHLTQLNPLELRKKNILGLHIAIR